MRLIAVINESLDAHLTVRKFLFDTPSVSSLSQQLDRHASDPRYASVHGRDTAEVHAADLKLHKFIDATTLNAATTLPGPAPRCGASC